MGCNTREREGKGKISAVVSARGCMQVLCFHHIIGQAVPQQRESVILGLSHWTQSHVHQSCLYCWKQASLVVTAPAQALLLPYRLAVCFRAVAVGWFWPTRHETCLAAAYTKWAVSSCPVQQSLVPAGVCCVSGCTTVHHTHTCKKLRQSCTRTSPCTASRCCAMHDTLTVLLRAFHMISHAKEGRSCTRACLSAILAWLC